MRSMCPLYTYSRDMSTWAARIALLNAGDIAIVVGENSGPGPFDLALAAHIHELEAKGVLVFGYVHVSYGARPLGEVLEDITDWRVDYGVKRVFLDEWSNVHHAELGLMWGAVRGRVTEADRKAGPYLIANPGAAVTWPSVPAGTLVVTHEDASLPNWTPKPWEATLVHSFAADLAAGRAALERWGWQWGWLTSDGPDGNPWDEVAA